MHFPHLLVFISNYLFHGYYFFHLSCPIFGMLYTCFVWPQDAIYKPSVYPNITCQKTFLDQSSSWSYILVGLIL